MSLAASNRERPAGGTRLASALKTVPLWAWWLLAVAVATGLALLAKGTGRALELVDSDDAMRLIQVRELLAGAAWFPVETPALGGAAGLVSHWSRLLDLPLALLLWLLGLAMPAPVAEMALVASWPVLLLGATLWAIARSTLAAHGRPTALLALALGSLSLIAYYQFAPGRVDHHNVMIAATVAAALMMWAAPLSPRAWQWAGALCALALAIGYEALAPVAVLTGLAAIRGFADRRMAASAGCFVIGLVAGLVLALAATVPPAQWLPVHCDALSLNVVMMAVAAGAGFVLVMRHGGTWSWQRQAAVLAGAGAVALVLLAALEPACLAGPMGQVPKALWPIWIAHVEEAKSLVGELLRGKPGAVGPLVVLVAGMGAAVAGLARSPRQGDGFLLGATIAFVALALWQQKYTAYASLLLAPGVAVLIARLPAIGEIGAPAVRILAVIVLNQVALLSLAMSLRSVLTPTAARPTSAAPAAADPTAALWACTSTAALQALRQVPPGLVVTHNDIGAHVAAFTPHRALSGPYHRIPDAIVTNHAILSATDPAAAGRLLARTGADYVLSCTGVDRLLAREPGWTGSLAAALGTGEAPSFLVPVTLADAPLYRLWRVRPDG